MSRLSKLCEAGVVLTDGAWGTEFQKRGLALGSPADLWNLHRAADVVAVARSYVEAGSRAILTNTFRANAVAMPEFADVLAEVNRRGAAISRSAGAALVFGSIGPTGRPLAGIRNDVAFSAFLAQAEALAEGGADALLLETFGDLEETRVAIRAARETGLPVVVSFAFDVGPNPDRTLTGATPEQAARVAVEEGADAVGANCGSGPRNFVELARRFRAAAEGLPVWAKPNAGLPTLVDGRFGYPVSPEEFAAFLPDLVAAGADFVGGCCGTSPEYVRALTAALSNGS